MSCKIVSNSTFSRIIGLGLLITVWFFISDVVLNQYSIGNNKIILDPIETLIHTFGLFSSSFGELLLAICNTLGRVIVAFMVSVIISLIFALMTYYYYNLRYILEPFINVLRASPIVAVIIFLLLIFPWNALSFIIAVFMTLPMFYQNFVFSLDNITKSELYAAWSIGLGEFAIIKHVIFPEIITSIIANLRNGFGMSLKIVITAEVLGLPTLSLGNRIVNAKQSFEYQNSFCYLFITIIIAYIVDYILSKISDKYTD